MRVGLLAPLLERIPPRPYGGTERVMAWLADELVALGLGADLLATGDCETRAQLVPLARAAIFPTVSTIHSRMDTPESAAVYEEFREQPVVSISDAQRRPLPHANWVATVHHGMPEHLYRRCDGGGSYLAFVGRIAPGKGVHVAIEVARRTGLPLKIAGRPPLEEWKYVEARYDHEYYESKIRPHLGTGGVEYVGELDEAGKQDLYGGAIALLFPIDWPEPFGLVLIEAMACGTPILARPRGSVPEIVVDGVNGYHCEDVDEMVRALERIDRIDRGACRREFERRFTARRMALDCLRVYEAMVVTGLPGVLVQPREPTELERR